MDDVVAAPRPFGQKLIYIGIATFIAACALLLALGGVWQPKSAAEPGFAVAPEAKPSDVPGIFQVTMDTGDRDKWVGFSLGAGKLDEVAGVPADIYARRYVLRAPLGAIDLGAVSLADAAVPASPTWVMDELVDGALQNRVLSTWYSYSYWTHLLRTKGRTFAVKLVGGGVAFVQVMSYNCAPEGTGCLTLRYRLGG